MNKVRSSALEALRDIKDGATIAAGATTLGTPGPDVAVPVSLAAVSALLVLGLATWAERYPTDRRDRPEPS